MLDANEPYFGIPAGSGEALEQLARTIMGAKDKIAIIHHGQVYEVAAAWVTGADPILMVKVTAKP